MSGHQNLIQLKRHTGLKRYHLGVGVIKFLASFKSEWASGE